MYGNTFTRSMRAFGHMALRPRDAARWMVHAVRPRPPLSLGLPWFSWKAIEYLRRRVKPGQRVFEWGGGGSTLFFMDQGCRVTTVESSAEWKNAIEKKVPERSNGALNIRLIPAESKDPKDVADYVRSVHAGAPWDVILVDGIEEDYLSRVDCIRELPGCCVPGGIVIVDDAWRSKYDVAADVLRGWEHNIFQGLGTARFGVTRTDVYVAPQ